MTARDPADALDRVRARARRVAPGDSGGAHAYAIEPDWHQGLHQQLDLPWPCPEVAEFERLWAEIVAGLREQGMSVGRASYGGWDDADPGFARAVWCLARHLQPQKVVETGVAHGITSRVILEALERDGAGRLWSIDLPATDPTIHGEIGAAVPSRLQGRWTYVDGASRKRLPPLLSEIGPIDLFVHDSSHTERNVSFELRHAWQAIQQGAIVADDVDQSRAFASFSTRHATTGFFVAQADDASALFGVALKGSDRSTSA